MRSALAATCLASGRSSSSFRIGLPRGSDGGSCELVDSEELGIIRRFIGGLLSVICYPIDPLREQVRARLRKPDECAGLVLDDPALIDRVFQSGRILGGSALDGEQERVVDLLN